MLSYDVAGTGPALVLLHSTVCDRRMWDPQWSVLADAGYRVVRWFWQREGELIDAGDIAGAVELNVATWLGPEASEPTRERVRLMQRHAFEVQLAAPEEYEPVEVAVDLSAITAPSLVVSGGKDLPDFRLIAARLTSPSRTATRRKWRRLPHLPQ